MESGLRLEDLENMSYSQKLTWLIKFKERKNKERLIFKLDIAEAFNMAYTGSQPPAKKGQSSRTAHAYKSWRRKLIRELNPNQRTASIWDIVDKQKKSLKIN